MAAGDRHQIGAIGEIGLKGAIERRSPVRGAANHRRRQYPADIAVKEIWTKDKPEYHGETVHFPPMMTWPKPVQKPHQPIIVGVDLRFAARRAIHNSHGTI